MLNNCKKSNEESECYILGGFMKVLSWNASGFRTTVLLKNLLTTMDLTWSISEKCLAAKFDSVSFHVLGDASLIVL